MKTTRVIKMNEYNVFVYGTLMYTAILNNFGLKDNETVTATLDDYLPKVVRGAHFPGLDEEKGKYTEGLVIKGVTREQLESLDRYEGEGELYDRITVNTYPDNAAETIECETYVFRKKELLIDVVWKPDPRQVIDS